jgi:hypothetical protein
MLRNALLHAGIVAEPTHLERILLDADIDPKRRGETLHLDEFARLADRLHAMSAVVPDLPQRRSSSNLEDIGGKGEEAGVDDRL